LVLREANRQAGQKRLPDLLTDSDPRVRFVAIQWIGEERLGEVWSQVKDELEQRLSTRQELEAYLATSAFLSKSYNPGQEARGEEFVAEMLLDKNTSPERRAFLLRMLPPESKSVAENQLQQWLASDSPALRLAVLGRVADGGLPKFLAESNTLSDTAMNAKLPLDERLEAIAAMSHDPTKHAATLKQLLDDKNPLIATQAGRTVRTNDQLAAANSIAFSGEGRTPLNDVATWRQILEKQPGDAKSGELIFRHAVAQCSRCHEAEGRGAAIGPNLTGIGRTMSRERLIESILQPSKEIAPQFAVWQIETTDGRILKGMYFGEEVDGTVIYANEQGKTFKVHPRDVESRTQQKQSIMPEGLPYRLTDQELRDLLAYLSEGRQK
jgi:putative heme-binding domain-containing protein